MTSYRVKLTLNIEVEAEVGDDGVGEPEYGDVTKDVRKHLRWLAGDNSGVLEEQISRAIENADVEVLTDDDI